MSPSSTPTRSSSPSVASVRFSSAVLPAPGEDITLTAHTPCATRSARLASATRSFSERIDSSTATRDTPVLV